jgi:hypothetical protein
MKGIIIFSVLVLIAGVTVAYQMVLGFGFGLSRYMDLLSSGRMPGGLFGVSVYVPPILVLLSLLSVFLAVWYAFRNRMALSYGILGLALLVSVGAFTYSLTL